MLRLGRGGRDRAENFQQSKVVREACLTESLKWVEKYSNLTILKSIKSFDMLQNLYIMLTVR